MKAEGPERPAIALPEPARGIWLETRELVRIGIGTVQGGQPLYSIGGGTMLAARHGHRRSSDIDIATPAERGSVGALHGPDNRELRAAFEALGWTVDNDHTDDFFAIRKGRTPGNRQAVEIWTHDVLPPDGVETAVVEGAPEQVNSDAVIMTGKTGRFHRAVARDLFDLTVLRTASPAAVEIAVNAIPPAKIRELAAVWTLKAPEIAEEARENIQPTRETADTDFETLGGSAAETLRAAEYSRVRIDADGGRVVVRTKSSLRPETRREWRPEEAGRGILSIGFDRRMHAMRTVPPQVIAYAVKLASEGRGGTVYEERNGRLVTSQTTDLDRRQLDEVRARIAAARDNAARAAGLAPADPSKVRAGGNPDALNIVRPGPRRSPGAAAPGPNRKR